MIPFSVLDLSPITAGATATTALANTLDLARHAERLGFNRYWLAEHHNMAGVASAATAVVIGHVAGGTSRIRVGAGGIMLPNHAPLVIAEQFGTLASLYPNRIDLGLGRAPGSDPITAHALRRTLAGGADTFPDDVREVQGYFAPAEPGQRVRAIPGEGLDVPVWILGSSLFGAQLAAAYGLPYAFASHFAPDQLTQAIRVYRSTFKPSAARAKSHLMLALNVFAADTDEEAQFLFSSLEQLFISLRRGTPGKLPPPRRDIAWSDIELATLQHALTCSVVGSRETVRKGIRAFIERTRPDELMVTATMFDHAARVRSCELVAAVRDELAQQEALGESAARAAREATEHERCEGQPV